MEDRPLRVYYYIAVIMVFLNFLINLAYIYDKCIFRKYSKKN